MNHIVFYSVSDKDDKKKQGKNVSKLPPFPYFFHFLHLYKIAIECEKNI